MENANCMECKNAIFDEVWGEYKCGINKNWIMYAHLDCEHYAEGKPQLSKHTYEYALSKGDEI